MNKLMIGCPVKNDYKYLRMMIDSLFNSTNSFDYLRFVDGGSNDGSYEYLIYLQKLDERIKVLQVKTKTPLEAYNLLFETAKGMDCDLLLTQTDVIFPKCLEKDWLAEMKQIAQNEEVGAITCLNGGGISGDTYIDGFPWLGGWCSYYPLRIIQKLGGYDDNYPGGYGVDIDYSYRIKLLGLKTIYTNYWVNHHMLNNREHDKASNSEQMKQDASKYFRRKFVKLDG